MDKEKRIVIKVGTAVLTGTSGVINEGVIKKLVESTVKLLESGCQIIIVTSGAIGAGLGRIKLYGHSLRHKQALASIGQLHLMNIYDKYFSRHKRLVAQVLLTKDDLDNHSRCINAKHTMETLLKSGVVPIVNENDTVAVDELPKDKKFGDNDILSAEVALKFDADMLIILTDVEGFCTIDPRFGKEVKLIKEVRAITGDLEKCAGRAGSQRGTGGMISKLQAMKMATSKGIVAYIANGRKKDVLLKILEGKSAGTKFLPRGKKSR